MFTYFHQLENQGKRKVFYLLIRSQMCGQAVSVQAKARARVFICISQVNVAPTHEPLSEKKIYWDTSESCDMYTTLFFKKWFIYLKDKETERETVDLLLAHSPIVSLPHGERGLGTSTIMMHSCLLKSGNQANWFLSPFSSFSRLSKVF